MRIILPGIWSRGRWIAEMCCVVCCLLSVASARQTMGQPAAEWSVAAAEEQAFRTAVDRVAAAVVRIEAAGVSEASIGGPAEAAPAAGPSSGLIVDPAGWVVTTSFAVPKDAKQAIVVLPGTSGGTRVVARAVGRDLARGLVLLQIEVPAAAAPLPSLAVAPRESWGVGQWTIALGRAWNSSAPSVAVGILSAVNRAWGKAVQTDASVSPANYGGPLIDIQGRVIGILAPVPADTAGMTMGTELYDSGIGFAVPLEDLLRVLPRLQQGETLSPGILGIGYSARDPFTAKATVATCRAGSPAARAGLHAGDTIVEAGGRSIARVAELRHVLAPLYAGDSVELVVERGSAEGEKVRVPLRVELVAALAPWRRSVLGIVPTRTANKKGENAGETPGVPVAWVWPAGPAAGAGLKAGDCVEAVATVAAAGEEGSSGGGERLEVSNAGALGGFVGGLAEGTVVQVTVRRDGLPLELEMATVVAPATVPELVPVSEADPAQAVVEKLPAPEIAHPPLAVLPAAAPESPLGTPLGVLVYFGSPQGSATGAARAAAAETEAVRAASAQWAAAASRYGVAVILPEPSDPQRWGREDIAGVARALDSLRQRRPIDLSRVAFAGSGAGAAMALLAAEALGPGVRGVALFNAGLPRQATVEAAEPGRSRVVLFGTSGGQPVPRLELDSRRLEEAGYPVGMVPPAALEQVPAETLCSWVESLGVL